MRVPRSQQGFTLPELLVAGGFIGVLAVLAIFFSHPIDFGPKQRNAERWTGVAQISQALTRYAKATGSLPPLITADDMPIGDDTDMVNLCPSLVPAYAKDLSVDPEAAKDRPGAACTKSDIALITGYTVHKTGDRSFAVTAPLAENGETIQIIRSF